MLQWKRCNHPDWIIAPSRPNNETSVRHTIYFRGGNGIYKGGNCIYKGGNGIYRGGNGKKVLINNNKSANTINA